MICYKAVVKSGGRFMGLAGYTMMSMFDNKDVPAYYYNMNSTTHNTLSRKVVANDRRYGMHAFRTVKQVKAWLTKISKDKVFHGFWAGPHNLHMMKVSIKKSDVIHEGDYVRATKVKRLSMVKL